MMPAGHVPIRTRRGGGGVRRWVWGTMGGERGLDTYTAPPRTATLHTSRTHGRCDPTRL